MKLKQFIFALVAMLSSFAFTANAQTAVSSFDELKAALANSTDIVVDGDIAVDEAITIPSGTSVAGDGTLRVQTKVYVVSTETPYPGVTYNKTATKNGSIDGTASCAVVYEISLDGGENWFTDTTNGKAQAVTVKKDGTKTISTSFQSAFTSAKCGEIVHMLKDAHVQSTNSKKNNGPLRSYYGLILEGNGHTIYTDVESSGASNEYSTIKFTSYLAGTGADVRPVLKNVTIDSQKNAKADIDVVSGDVTFTVSLYNVNLLNKTANATLSFISGTSLILNKSNVKLFDASIPAWDAGSANAIEFYSGDYSLSFNSKCKVYGGTFSKDAANYLVERAEMSNVNGKYVVTYKEEKAEVAPSVNTTVDSEVAKELVANEAVANNSVELPADVADFTVQLTAVESDNEVTTKVTYTVTPSNVIGEKVSTPSEAITFRLPVPAAWSGQANVYHEGTLLGAYTIKEENGAKYVEVSSSSFSEFSVEAIVTLFDGEGTETSPYLIDSADKLATLRNEVNGGEAYEGVYFKLTSDITLNGEWTAIGNGSRSSKSYTGNAFKGVFDGGDNTISGLTITSTTAADAAIGLFGVVDGGTVKNVNLTDVNVNVTNSNLAGAAIGMMLNGATAEGITVSGAVVGHDGVGGIVGRLIINGTIANCTNNASVTSNYGGIGGIVGKAYYEDGANTATFASITNCTNKGTITAPMYVGGIAGLARANVSGCVNESEIVGGTQTGGIVGQLMAAGTVSANENKATVRGTSHVGGIIGDYTQSGSYTYNNVSIVNNINRGELSAQQCAAIMGCNNIDGFTAMTATGNVSYYHVEGLVLFGNPEDMVIDATNKFIVPVAQVGAETYYTLAEAVAAAQNGETITLIDNVVLAERVTIPADKTLTIDLNGKSISMEESIITTAYAINNLGNLTITDGVGGGSINARGIYNGYGDGGANVATAKITVVNGTINAKGTNGGGAAIFNYGVADIQGGTFTSVASYAIALQTGSTMTIGENAIITGGINSWQSTLTITGGTISNDKSGKHVVYAGESAVTINGGTFHNNNSGNATIMASGSTAAVEITGGTFTLNIVNAASSYLIDATSSATYTISGGSFTGGIRAQGGTKYEISGGTFTNEYGNYDVYEGGDINISGGTFTGSYAQKFATDNLAADYELDENGTVVQVNYVAQIGETKYETFAEALEAASAMTGDVTVEILDKVTFNQPLIGNYTSINFVGKAENAEMYLDVQGYTTATGKKVSFTDLKLSKSEGGFIANAGFMNVAFGIYDVEEVTYTNCTFENGACASSGKVTFNGCTFKKSWDKYGLWAYGNVDVTVQGSTFADYRGIKMYAENGADASVEKANLTVKNTNFSAVDNKPAIVLTYGESVVLEGNTYSSTGTFELDLDGKPNGVAVTSDVAPVCVNDNGACGVLVDGKIYTTVAQAADVATSGSNVTLLHNSAETVELAEGVVLDKNGFEAAGVTVAVPVPVAKVGDVEYTTLAAAVEAAQSGDEIVIIANVELTETTEFPAGKTITLNLNNKKVSAADKNVIKNNGAALTIKNGTIERTGTVAGYAVNIVSGTLEVENVTINGGLYTSGSSLVATNTNINQPYSSRHAIYAYNCAVTINSGTYHNDNAGNAAVFAYGSSVVTINNGTFSIDNGKQTFGWTSCLLDANAGGKYVINGGEFKGHFRVQANSAMEINGGTFENTHGEAYAIYGTAVVKGGTFTDGAAKNFATSNLAGGYELNADGTVTAKPVASINGTTYMTLAEAAAAAQSGDEIVMLADVTLAEALTLPAGITFNGNDKQITGTLVAAGDITFAGVTKAGDLDFAVGNTVVNIPAGASLQLNGSARMSIGFGTTFNITGNITEAKTANVADLTPSLVIPGASFTGAGVTFNVTNAYISVPSSYCSTSKTASGTFDFNITNSIWESAGKLAFEEQSVNAKVDFALVNSVLTTGSHLVFGTASGEEGVVIDNSYVNKGTSRQLENCGTMTVKNGSVVNGAVATSSNAKNPGTVIVENATYAVTGEFSGSDLGTGTIIIKKGANVSVGSIKAGANITVDAEAMAAGDEINFTVNLSQFTGTLSVINNDKLEAKIVDGKVVLAAKPVATVNGVGYATLAAAYEAAVNGDVIVLNESVTSFPVIKKAVTFKGGKENAAVEINVFLAQNFTAIDGTVKFENLTFNKPLFTEQGGTKPGLTIEFEGCNFNVPSDEGYAILIGTSWSNSVVKGLKVNNCNFKYVGDVFKGGYMLYVQCVNEVTITNNTIDGNNLYRGAIHLGDAIEHATVATVSNNTIKNFCRGVMMGNRVAGSSATISGNTFENINYSDKDSKPAQECAPIFIHSNATSQALKIALTDNKVENCTNPMIYSEDTDLIKYYVTEFTGNTVDGSAVELANSYNAPNQVFPVATINDAEYFTLQAAIDAAILMTGDVTIEIMSGTYAQDINLTNAAVTAGNADARPNITFKPAADADVTFAGTTTLGYRVQNVGASMWQGEVIFEGIKFNHAENGKHSLDIQDVKGITLLNCTVTGDGEYGIGSNGSNATPKAAFTNCTFENGAMQVLGQLSANLVIDNSTFNNFSINAQGGTTPGLTIKNSIFNMTLTDAHVGQSFYVVRSNANPINIQNTKVNVDSEVSSVAADQAKWGLFWARQDADAKWSIDACEVNLTDAAMAQTELLFTKNAATTYDKAKDRIIVTNLTSTSNNVADLVKRAEGCATVNNVKYLDGELDLTGLVAKVGDAYYATLQAAVEAAQNGETIILIADVELTALVVIPEGKELTLDLNGKTITCGTDGYCIENTAGSTVTIKDTKGNGVVNGTIYNQGESTMIIDGGTYNAIGSYALLNNAATMTINGGVIYGKDSYPIYSYNDGHKLTINNVTVNGECGCINAYYAGEVIINDGTFNFTGREGYTYHIVYVSTGTTMTINGGTFKKVGDVDVNGEGGGGICAAGTGKLIITGGTFDGAISDIDNYSSNTTIEVSGGNFSDNSAKNYVAKGFELKQNADGTYGVVEVPTDVKVATLAELQAALADNSNELPIIITAQIEIPAGETVTIDLNGKTVNSVFNGNSTTNHIYALSNKGTLTILDSKGNGSINSRGIYNYGSLTLNAGAINAIDGNGGYAVINQSGSTFVMNGGVVATTNEDDHQSSSGGYDATALKVSAGCTATLNGGTINNVCDFTYAIDAAGTLNIPATSTITVNGTHGAIYVSGGTTTIDAGTFQIPADKYSRTDNVLYVAGGSLVVNGGTFIGDSDTASGGSCLYDAVGKAVVNGGTFKGSSGGDVWGTTGTTIKGGTFENLTEKQHIADGYELDENGTVVQVNYVAQIGETKYETLEDAVAAANDADSQTTITLLADIDEYEGDDIVADVVLDLNGKTVTSTGGYFFWLDSGKLIVKDSSAEKTGKLNGVTTGNAILLYGNSTLVVEDVDIFSNNNVITTFQTNNTVTINGGKLEANSATQNSAALYLAGSESTVTVNAGTIIGDIPFNYGTLLVNGGSFTKDVSGYCAAGYATVLNEETGMYEIVAVTAENAAAKIGDRYFLTLNAALQAATVESEIVVLKDFEGNLESLKGTIVPAEGKTVTVNATNTGWYYLGSDFTIGEGVTFNMPDAAFFVHYTDEAVIKGKVTVNGLYIRYAGTRLTVEAPGALNVTGETFIIRDVEGDGAAGLYIVGDDNDETVELTAPVVYFYQGMINAKNANINVGTYWQTQETDANEFANAGAANLVLDNSVLNVTVRDHAAKATGNSTVTLKNGALLNTANSFIGNAAITVDAAGITANTIVISGNVEGLTGEITLTGNDVATYAKTAEGLVVVMPKVAAIGETVYATLQAAIDAAQAGDVITVLEDVVLEETVTVAADKELTLDLNGKTVSMVYAEDVTANHAMITNNGDLTIQSSVEGGKLSYTYTGENLGTTYAANTITSEPGSVLTVKSGTIENLTYDKGVIAYAIDALTNGNGGDVTVNIEGGVITSKRQAVRVFANSTTCTGALNISGGEFTGRVIVQNASAKANKAALNITGGTFNANEYKSDVLYVGGSQSATIDIDASVSGGTFNGEITDTNVAGFISGGTYTTDVTAFCAEHFNCVRNENGTYSVDQDPNYIFELEIIDGEYGNYTFEEEMTVGKLTYVRTLPAAGIWYPVFLPFDVPVDALAANFDVARINDLHTNFSEEDGSIEKMWIEYIVRKSGTLSAGKPFLVRAKSSDVLDMVIELENVTLKASSEKSSITVSSAIIKATFKGVYEATSGLVSTPSTRYMAVTADGVWDEFDGYALNPFRVMMTLEILDEEYYVASTASFSVGARVIGEENEDGTTTIYDVEADREENDMIFDLQGRRVLETEKGGIYIKNGKKFIAQ